MAKRRLQYEKSVPLLATLAALPAVVVALVLLWSGEHSDQLRWTLTLAIVGGWAVALLALRERLVRPLQTLSNMLAALREEDYSMRARLGDPDHSLGLLSFEVNTLGELLREQRLEVLEATALLRRVMAEIDVAVFAFDDRRRLCLVNRAGEELLDRPEEALTGRDAEWAGLADLLEGEAPRMVDRAFPGRASRWELRRGSFRQEGRPHTLLVLSDLSRVLREEERKAWRRLIRVLSHEINNSLAPIRSIAESLRSMLERTAAVAVPGRAADPGAAEGPGADPGVAGRPGAAPGVDPDWLAARRDALLQGLSVISGRSEALARFMSSYARLARLPAPELAPLEVGAWVRRVTRLETRLPVEIVEGPPAEIEADGDQLDQLLINLVDNAVEAAGETGGGVRVGWTASRRQVEIRVEDDGPGIPETENLFVPFFTTKPDGSGIGLALSRQIAEAHGGRLTLENREEGTGCVARLRLPRG